MKEFSSWSLALASSVGDGRDGLEAIDLVEHGLSSGDGGDALGPGVDVKDAGMIVRRAEAAVDAIGEAEFRTYVLDDA